MWWKRKKESGTVSSFIRITELYVHPLLWLAQKKRVSERELKWGDFL